MPQFDFSTYNPQIFWFTLCFAALYLSSSFIILPRIRDIIASRKNVVDSDKLASLKLEKQIAHLQNKAQKLQQDAGKNYEDKMNETTRNIVKERDQALTSLKTDLDEVAKKSRSEIKLMLQKSEDRVSAMVKDLVKSVKTKILN